MTRLSCLAVLLSLLGGCGPSGSPVYHGYIYFSSGPYLGRFELQSGNTRLLSNFGEAHIESVAGFGRGKLLLSTLAPEGDRYIARILEYDVGSGRSRDIFSGRRAVYLEASDTIVYDEGEQLLAVPRGYGKRETTVVARYTRGGLSALLALDQGRVLYETGNSDRREIALFDSRTGEQQQLDALAANCSLRSAAWVAGKQRLACRAGLVGEYHYVALDGVVDASLALPEGRRFDVLAYAREQAILVVAERRKRLFNSSPRSAVWAYSIETGELHQLAAHQSLGEQIAYSTR